jgi:hypothetical protein
VQFVAAVLTVGAAPVQRGDTPSGWRVAGARKRPGRGIHIAIPLAQPDYGSGPTAAVLAEHQDRVELITLDDPDREAAPAGFIRRPLGDSTALESVARRAWRRRSSS